MPGAACSQQTSVASLACRVPLNTIAAVPGAECAAASRALLALARPTLSPSAAVAMTEQRAARKRRRTSGGASRSNSNPSTDYDEEESELVAAYHRSSVLTDWEHHTPHDDEAGSVRFLAISPSLRHTSSEPASEDSSVDTEGNSLRARMPAADSE